MQPAWSERDSGYELAMVGTHVSQLVDLMSAEVHEAGELTPPPSGAPSPSMEG